MEVVVNYWAVLLAAASSMVVGAVWYAKPVMGAKWMKLVGLKDKDLEKGATKALSLTFLVSLLTAFVLAHVTYLSNQFFQNDFLNDALSTAFWLWAGLTAARFITHDLFEKRPTSLTVMNVLHELVTLMVMALVIGLMKP